MLSSFSPQIWLSLSRYNNRGGLAGLCCLSSTALPLTSAVRQLGPMWSSLRVLHLKKQRRQEFSSFFETLANISEFIAHGLQIFFFPHFLPSSPVLPNFREPLTLLFPTLPPAPCPFAQCVVSGIPLLSASGPPAHASGFVTLLPTLRPVQFCFSVFP